MGVSKRPFLDQKVERGGKEEEGQVRVNWEECVVGSVRSEKTGEPTTGTPAQYRVRDTLGRVM